MRSKNRNQKVSKTRVNMRKKKSISGKLNQRRKTKTRRNRRRSNRGGSSDPEYPQYIKDIITKIVNKNQEIDKQNINFTLQEFYSLILGDNTDVSSNMLTNKITQIKIKNYDEKNKKLYIELNFNGKLETFYIVFEKEHPIKIYVISDQTGHSSEFIVASLVPDKTWEIKTPAEREAEESVRNARSKAFKLCKKNAPTRGREERQGWDERRQQSINDCVRNILKLKLLQLG